MRCARRRRTGAALPRSSTGSTATISAAAHRGPRPSPLAPAGRAARRAGSPGGPRPPRAARPGGRPPGGGRARRDGLLLLVVHADDLVEPGQLEDLPVVVREP